MSFVEWLMYVFHIRPEDMLLTGIVILGVAVALFLGLMFYWVDKHNPKE